MRTWLKLMAVLCVGCGAESDAPFLETEYVRYVTDQPFTPCGGLARNTDRKIEYLFDHIDEPYPPPQAILYKWLADDSSLVCIENAIGCTRLDPDGPTIASVELGVFHELAHAVHLYALGYSHPVLNEGFAVYYTGRYGDLSPDGMMTFASDIESMISLGDLAKEQYPLAAKFVGATIERHGLSTFKNFWKDVGYSSTLAEFRAAYEAHYEESWTEALAMIASHKRASWMDPECEGEAKVLDAEGLQLIISETCQDEGVVGPVRNGDMYAGEMRISVEIPIGGSYRFAFSHSGAGDGVVASFRGCESGGPAPVTPINVFLVQDDREVLLDPGRYLLGVRVPLTPGEVPVEVSITPKG